MPSRPEPRRPEGLSGLPERLAVPLRACLAGDLPANVCLMRLLIESRDAAEVDSALAEAERGLDPCSPETARFRELLHLRSANPQAGQTVKAVLAHVEHDGPTPADTGAALASIAAAFERAARISPEASVALYSLGNPDLLQAATAEIVALLRKWDLVGPDRTVLDLGCGVGRLTRALAPEAGTAVGTDISVEMLDQARRRAPEAGRAMFVRTSGRDLACLGASRFDLVLAVDSFPYLVQAGGELAAGHVAEAARILRPDGTLLVLNYSYRSDPEADAADLARLAAANGFDLVRAGERPFALWDGIAFQMVRQVGPADRTRSRDVPRRRRRPA